MKQQSLFKIRDQRQKNWLWIDYAYFNGYAKKFGPTGTAIYVSLCRHADNENQRCFPSMEMMAKENNISRFTVSKYIKLFLQEKIISVEKERNTRTQKWLNNVYTLLDQSEWKSHVEQVDMGGSHVEMSNEPCGTDTMSHVEQVDTNNTHITIPIINNTHIATQSVADVSGKEINEILVYFKEVNPSYERLFGNKTQRTALGRLIKKHTSEKIIATIKLLPKINVSQYAPTITTPLQLEEKFGVLLAFFEREKAKNKVNEMPVAGDKYKNL